LAWLKINTYKKSNIMEIHDLPSSFVKTSFEMFIKGVITLDIYRNIIFISLDQCWSTLQWSSLSNRLSDFALSWLFINMLSWCQLLSYVFMFCCQDDSLFLMAAGMQVKKGLLPMLTSLQDLQNRFYILY